MNEARIHQYLELIQKLLSCPNGDEPQIVQKNEEFQAFLSEVLTAEAARYNGDRNIQIYPILQKYQHLLDENFAQILRDLTLKFAQENPEAKEDIAGIVGTLSIDISDFPLGRRANNLEIAITGYETVLTLCPRADVPQKWAMTQNNLGNAYRNRIKGDRGENLENAIAAYQLALQVRTRTAFPEDWAMTQYNLGIAYWDRIKGDRGENIENAIAAYQLALQVRTRTAFPEKWAMTQNNLAVAYWDRIKGDRGENIENAIAAYQLALQVRTRTAFPEDWAMTQNNLGIAYWDHIKGDRGENIENAIAAYQLALEVYTRTAFPEQWATIQNNLGTAYSDRIKGDRGENIENAIAAYQLALEVRTRTAFPEKWANTQNNLGIAYNNRIKGDRGENIENAIAAYQLALKVYTRTAFPEQWANTQNNLAVAYWDRIKGDRGENIENAIAAYQLALEVRTRTAFPEQWAITQNNLGTAYSDRIKGDRGENIEYAIAAYQLALEVRTRTAFPEQWAMTQHNLASAYLYRIKGDRGENIENAIISYDHALEIRTPESLPIDCLQTGNNLGNLGFKEGNWQLAIRGYAIAIEAVEISRSWATDDERRNEILANAITVYENIIQSYIELKQYDKAIEYAERSRSRRLVDLMASNDVYSKGEVPEQVKEYLKKFYQILREIENQRQGKNQPPENNQNLAMVGKMGNSLSSLREIQENIKKLQNQQTKIWKEIRKLDPVLAGQIKVAHLQFTELQSLITDDKTAILSFYTTAQHTHIFVLTKSAIQVHTCENQGRGEIQDYIWDNWLIPYQQWQYQGNDQWLKEMPKVLGEIANRLNINELIDQHLQNIEELIIIPHLYLHLIPFAALPVNSSQSPTLSDKYLIRIIPSCQILQFCQNRGEVENPEYGIIDNASDDRYITSFAGDKISEMCKIEPENRLQGKTKATVENYRNLAQTVAVLHSIHHASSNLNDPLLSALLLGDGEITLGELLTPGWRMPHLSDVFLSCCETGLGIPEKLTDDMFTLSAGFLCAGARNVISTLWSVNDLATSLFCLFYYQYRQGGKDRVTALQLAQNDLRNKTAEELNEDLTDIGFYLMDLAAVPEIDQKMKDKISQSQAQISKIQNGSQDIKPFESPFYWGGFVCQGLR